MYESLKSVNQTGRAIYFDYLRVFAALAVMIIHTSSQNWYGADVYGFEWKVFNFFSSVFRWGAPIFIMISGSIFLSRDIPQKKIFSKYVLRLVISYIVWSSIYMLFDESDTSFRIALFYGHYHMWFILMMIGLYICIPFLKPIIESENKIKYYLILAFIFAFAFPEIVTLANDFGNGLIIEEVNAIEYTIGQINMSFVLGYASYFVWGYYLNKKDISKKLRIVIYCFGLVGFALTIILDLVVALRTQQPCMNYYDYFAVNVLMESTAVFVWFKYRNYDRVIKLHPLIAKLSKYSFGAYLVHALILEKLDSKLGINTLSFNAVLSVIIIGVIVFVVSFTISALLNHIPVLKKYIV